MAAGLTRRSGSVFGGTEYEIDLSKKNAAAFRKQIAPYVEHGRKMSRSAVRRGVRTAASRQRSSHIRAWAMDQGITVSERGRIPASVVEQYEAATGRLARSTSLRAPAQ